MFGGIFMKFFDGIFEVKNDSYYGVSGLNPELNCIYIYNYFSFQWPSLNKFKYIL